MTTPNFDTAGTSGQNSSTNSSTNSGSGNTGTGMNSGSMGSSSTGKSDDVSFGQSTSGRGGQGGGSSMDQAKDTVKQGISSAEDAVGQLQQKASDVTSRLINNIDVDDLTQKLEQQVRDHPARTLAMAIGAGFLLGRAAKR
ncbi:MAG: hypothetical protein ACR2MQ_04075 [Gemmatimonadaceae bacterium]